ncbi:MarR family winged helix-turn-helix transcriptional regulator [Streptomyces sp. NPDC051907]|uniref:MarR family winged helix-turn-helix transcriptional regulator n=1 Tax=Streptomyces sp. NPDC051907 TaxID=3155284 RepID=UPI00341AEC2A
MSTATPSVNGQIVGLAHYASRAVLERRVLAGLKVTFQQSVALNAVDQSGGDTERAAIVDRMTSTLKIDDSDALASIDGLIAAGLLEVLPGEEPRVGLTEAGKSVNGQIRAAVPQISAQLYAGFSAEELAVAGRVLTTVTARANAELDKL